MFPCTAYSTSEHSCQALLYFISLYIHEHECFTEMDDENMLKNLPFENFHDPQTIRLLPRKFMKRKKKTKKRTKQKTCRVPDFQPLINYCFICLVH